MRLRLVWIAMLAIAVSGVPSHGWAQSFEVVHKFSASPGAPSGPLVEVSNGVFYGTTEGGGEFGGGTIFRMDSNGAVEVLHQFRAAGTEGYGPRGGLVRIGDDLYGTTVQGGPFNGGTVFRLSLSGDFSVVTDRIGDPAVSAPNQPGVNVSATLLAASDGWLYGVTNTNPAIFRVHPVTGEYEQRFSFVTLPKTKTFVAPSALMEGSDGQIYGTVQRGGTGNDPSQQNAAGIVYRMNQSGDVEIIHQFVTGANEISLPFTALTQHGAFFYGLTASAGLMGTTALYQMDFNGSVTVLNVLAEQFVDQSAFEEGPRLAAAVDGSLYAAAPGPGSVWKFDGTGGATAIYTFPNPGSPVRRTSLIIATDGRLYGGQPHPFAGSVYRLTTAGADYEEVTVFKSETGNLPRAPLFKASDGQLYGTASEGGVNNAGTVFRLDAQGDVTVLHAFAPGEGGNPLAGLRQGSDGWLYGTTSGEQTSECGSVFRVSLAGVFQTVHTFDCNDGQSPRGPVVPVGSLWLYGSTSGGGANGAGTIFRVSTAGAFEVVHDFGGPDGSGPIGALVHANNGLVYGATTWGGAFDLGTVFSISANGQHTLIYSFGDDPDYAAYPQGGLVQTSDGFLYGTTSEGGENGAGILYRISTAGQFEMRSTSFDLGYAPTGELVEGPDHLLYGTTSSSYPGDDGDTAGTIFRVGASGAVLTVKRFEFVQAQNGTADAFDGASPMAGMVVGYEGLFYGTTNSGGSGSNGTIFRIALASETPAGSNVEVTPVDPVTGTAPVNLTFEAIGEPGTTTISLSTATPVPPPATTFNVGGTPTYFDVETTATFAGAIQVCFDYSTLAVPNPSTAILLHYNGTDWEDVTTSNNPTTRLICGSVTSLSPFVIASPVGASYEVRARFDQEKVYKAGSTVPIRIQILQDQMNVSATSLSVVATGLRRKSEETNWSTPEDPGASNPDLNFVYQVFDGEPGYRFNLKTGKSYRGTYELRLSVGSGAQEMIVEFQVR